jgi:N-acetylmuramoyl-L-alanine amidase
MLEMKRKLLLNGVGLLFLFCLVVRPGLNAPDLDSESAITGGPRSLARYLFFSANQMSRALRERPDLARDSSYLRRVVATYDQVVRLSADPILSASSLMRAAELVREVADNTGDGKLYQQAIALLRKVIADYPNSNFVGQALTQIAEIYAENLQDLDDAVQAYQQIIAYYPNSVLAREARAVLARAQCNGRAPDVIASQLSVTPCRGPVPELLNGLYLTNVRNFSGPDYARVVLDLSVEGSVSHLSGYTTSRLSVTPCRSANSLCIYLRRAAISPSLYGRRFCIAQPGMLKRITVSEQAGSAVEVKMEVGSLSDTAIFRLSDPERIVIDLYARSNTVKDQGVHHSAALKKPNPILAPRPLFSLPEITEPIMPYQQSSSNEQAEATAAKTAAADSKAAVSDTYGAAPVKCIVIDPGHGGHDTGTIGENGLREKDLTLDVARRLRAYIKRKYPEIEVVLTRDSDRYVALEERTAIANSRRADLFISIHANASPSRIASGVETFFVSPDRAKEERQSLSATSALKGATQAGLVVASVEAVGRIAAARDLARYIQAGLVRGIGAASARTGANRGVKHAPFAVLAGATMPSVLAEVSFVSNPRDETLLQTAQFRERIAASLFAGLSSYLKSIRQVTQNISGHAPLEE